MSAATPLIPARHKDVNRAKVCDDNFVEFVTQWQGTPRPREGQRLAWVAPDQLRDYPMPPADLPLIPILRDWL